MNAFDDPVRDSLLEFVDEDLDGSWSGQREREAVSLFAFGHLMHQVEPRSPLADTSQIGLEVAVPQVNFKPEHDPESRKSQVCKDLIIWAEPRQTCWDEAGEPTIPPAAILEWKFDQSSVEQNNVEWLDAFTDEYPDCVGYVITANQPGPRFTLSCTRVTVDHVEQEWIYVP